MALTDDTVMALWTLDDPTDFRSLTVVSDYHDSVLMVLMTSRLAKGSAVLRTNPLSFALGLLDIMVGPMPH